ncbi:MAG: glycosyltransferase, partial [Bacteroidota bacterium]|nr:glycosyltransferase [Bacteroidota bacterium]
PYAEYIDSYREADIILDQTYAEDQGYNALEAMAQGKVVFTGAGASFCERYQVAPNSVAIHTIPDAEKIAQDLEELILNPQRIAEIGTRAKRFVQEHHNYLNVAEKYVSAWNSIKSDDAVSASSEAQKSDTKNSKPPE